MNWKDISKHGGSDKDRAPKTWELRRAGLYVVVTRHVDFPPDEWVMTCKPWFTRQSIGRGTAEEAKREAEELIRGKITEAAVAFARVLS